MASAPPPEKSSVYIEGHLTRRAVIWLFGSLLMVLNAYVGTMAYVVVQALLWTQTSLLRGPIVGLFFLALLNLLLARFARRWVFSRAELLLLYTMLCISTCMGGIGFVQFLINYLAAPFYFASESNGWAGLLWPHIPAWFSPRREETLRAFYRGNASLYNVQVLMDWAVPVLAWTAFIFALYWVMLCATALLRRQWVEEERLTFPLAYLPIEMTADSGTAPFWKNRLMWFGFLLAGGLESLNFLSYLYPSLPSIPIKPIGPNQIDPLLTERPWNAIGMFRLAFYPFAIGIAYLLSLEVSFSCWFLYLCTKAANIFCAAAGLSDGGGGGLANRAPYLREQSVGAYLGIALFSLWMARRALKHAWEEARRPTGADARELMSFRMALVGGGAGLVFLVGFLAVAGLALPLAVFLVIVYLGFAVTLARIVSEVGAGWAAAPSWSPSVFTSDVFGADHLSAKNLVLLHGYTDWLEDMRDNPMPQTAKGMKLAQSAGVSARRFLGPLVWAGLFGTLCAFWAHLHIYYVYGATTAKVRPWLTTLGLHEFEQTVTLLKSPTPQDGAGLVAAGFGMALVVALSRLRLEFSWWPFHPLGYALATTNSLDYMWFPFFLAWLAKYLTVRYGGIRAYRIALPFFLGLILGDYVVPTLWGLWGMVANQQQYMAFPH